MDTTQKNQIVKLIQTEKDRLGSFAKVAKKCSVSEATISLMRNNNWEQITTELWLKVGHGLGFRSDNWMIARNTRDYQYVTSLVSNAKEKSMFIIIANEAGSGKTTGLEHYCIDNANQGAFYLKAREWTSKVFLQKLMKMLGMTEPRGYQTADELLELVTDSLSERALIKPVICIDEADKLKPSAKRILIYAFNELEDRCAFIIAGTEALKKEIESGVKYSKSGYDEIESRFGRAYMSLIGANKKDVSLICKVNGIQDDELIAEIWKEVGTKYVPREQGRTEVICDDLRRLKRVIQREQMRQAS